MRQFADPQSPALASARHRRRPPAAICCRRGVAARQEAKRTRTMRNAWEFPYTFARGVQSVGRGGVTGNLSEWGRRGVEKSEAELRETFELVSGLEAYPGELAGERA